MPSGRRSARRQAVFILYQEDLLHLSAQAALDRTHDSAVDPYTEALVRGVSEHLGEIDPLLDGHLEGWEIGRLGSLERSILRLAAYELVYEADIPAAVVIDQAVESAKRFCSDEAGALVNGVLGALAASAKPAAAEAALELEERE
jgi:N utilization substance protein B